MRIALGVEYDGSGFSGWESQRGRRTVQTEVERALSRVADKPVRTVCAGRTDAAVHAWGQVIHMDTIAVRDQRGWVRGGNSNLPDDIAITWARPVPDEFHARFSARSRFYRYIILNSQERPALHRCTVTWESRPLDAGLMQSAAGYLLGEHDFTSYRSRACQSPSPVRKIYGVDVKRVGNTIVIQVVANAFLHHMVRNIAGVLMAIGRGTRPPIWARQVLEARDRCRGGVTAPPQGLYLVGVEYPERYGLPFGNTEPSYESF